jgi:nitrite reductase/ring-hydroxylating ferredoxin subunit
MADGERLICASVELADGGPGVRFELDPKCHFTPVGFAVRHCGAVRAYVNRCPHAGTELDWNPGEFRDETGLYLMCATHGALFEPGTGYCVAGPCRGASLEPLAVGERDGRVVLLDNAPASRTDSR